MTSAIRIIPCGWYSVLATGSMTERRISNAMTTMIVQPPVVAHITCARRWSLQRRINPRSTTPKEMRIASIAMITACSTSTASCSGERPSADTSRS